MAVWPTRFCMAVLLACQETARCTHGKGQPEIPAQHCRNWDALAPICAMLELPGACASGTARRYDRLVRRTLPDSRRTFEELAIVPSFPSVSSVSERRVVAVIQMRPRTGLFLHGIVIAIRGRSFGLAKSGLGLRTWEASPGGCGILPLPTAEFSSLSRCSQRDSACR
jgi:hypothetical protein